MRVLPAGVGRMLSGVLTLLVLSHCAHPGRSGTEAASSRDAGSDRTTTPLWFGFGASVAAAAVGSGFMVSASESDSHAQRAAFASEARAFSAKADQQRTVGFAAMGAGVLSAAVTAAWWLWRSQQEAPPTRSSPPSALEPVPPQL